MSDYPLKDIELEKGAYRRSVYQRYGRKGFTKRGTIEQWVVNKDKMSGNKHIRKMANLAKTFHRITIGDKSIVY